MPAGRRNSDREGLRSHSPIGAKLPNLALFFQNCPPADEAGAVEARLLNADIASVHQPSATLEVLERMIQTRNDCLRLSRSVCAVVVPHTCAHSSCERPGGDQRSLRSIADQRSGRCRVARAYPACGMVDFGSFDFLSRRSETSALHVIAVGFVQPRPPHSFEISVEASDGLYNSASFARAVDGGDGRMGHADPGRFSWTLRTESER